MSQEHIPPEDIETCATQMADAVFANAKTFLEGGREHFHAMFALGQAAHRLAAARMSSLLVGSTYDERVLVGSHIERWTPDSVTDTVVLRVREYVAGHAGRRILAETMYEGNESIPPVFTPTDITYRGEPAAETQDSEDS